MIEEWCIQKNTVTHMLHPPIFLISLMTLTNKGSSTVNTSLISSLTGSNFTFSNAMIQDTRGGTVNTAAKLQTTVSITDKATAPPAWAVC